MATSRCNRLAAAGGFTLLEVIVSMGILTVGLVSVAALVGQTSKSAAQSKYMSVASTLVAEKLEDLNRWSAKDPNVTVPSGSTSVGSLTSDVTRNVSASGTTTRVNYYDEIRLSATGGSIAETVSGLDASGNVNYTSITHGPDGSIVTNTSSSAGSQVNTLSFKRRWTIEKDVPVTGVRRITVAVFTENASIQPTVSFQMTLVRP